MAWRSALHSTTSYKLLAHTELRVATTSRLDDAPLSSAAKVLPPANGYGQPLRYPWAGSVRGTAKRLLSSSDSVPHELCYLSNPGLIWLHSAGRLRPNSSQVSVPFCLEVHLLSSKVLVVEDDPSFCDLLQEMLRAAEMEAHGTTDSKKAVAWLMKEKFDAVFLDMHMPAPDGIEVIRQMRASGFNRTTPIIVITGEEDRGLMARAFQAGANFFLFKPVDRTRLLKLMNVTRCPIEHERRRFQRVKVRSKVRIESDQDRFEGLTLDLSLNGMLVQADRVVPVGSLVRVLLESLPGKPPIRASARVKRLVGNDCMGLELESGGPDRERLAEFLIPLVSQAV